jgi:predicted alpha/beta superfamily hydrolase
MADARLYRTETVLRRVLRVSYPAGNGKIVLRTEQDWNRDVEAVSVSEDGTTWTFELEADQPFLYFKPCLVRGGEHHWSLGSNKLVLMGADDAHASHPYFFGTGRGRFTNLVEIESKILDRPHRARVFVPPGYDENTTASYPVMFMQDGQNLFFPEEAFMGRDWKVDATHHVLASMNAIEDMIFVGLYSGDRMKEYTSPGYVDYGRSLVEEVVPAADRILRVGNHRRFRSVWGSSLGGVVAFYCVWQHPEVFGSAVCMSSTFSHKNNLIERVLSEPFRDVAFYLDSGWPGDNYEVTMAMAVALISRGWIYGRNLFHLCFPMAEHDETAWGVRLHLPMQLINGSVARASRLHHPVLTS